MSINNIRPLGPSDRSLLWFLNIYIWQKSVIYCVQEVPDSPYTERVFNKQAMHVFMVVYGMAIFVAYLLMSHSLKQPLE